MEKQQRQKRRWKVFNLGGKLIAVVEAASREEAIANGNGLFRQNSHRTDMFIEGADLVTVEEIVQDQPPSEGNDGDAD